MSENKRFTLAYEKGNWWAVKDGDITLWKEEVVGLLNQLNDENEQLKKELGKFKEWEKHIGDVKREELDRVFKMSIYEIAEAFEYYKERIKKLERELEELDEYKPYSIKRAKKPYATIRWVKSD